MPPPLLLKLSVAKQEASGSTWFTIHIYVPISKILQGFPIQRPYTKWDGKLYKADNDESKNIILHRNGNLIIIPTIIICLEKYPGPYEIYQQDIFIDAPS